MEGMLVHYDGTIRNSNSQMIQLRYGEDGMDGALMEFQQIPIIKPSHAAFKRKFYLDPTNHRQDSTALNDLYMVYKCFFFLMLCYAGS